MTEKTAYELKGTSRSACMTDRATLDGFHPLESDWRELMRWLMSVSGELPYYDRSGAENGSLSSLWENQVLTVLVEILRRDLGGSVDSFVEGRGTSARQSHVCRLREDFENWLSRLEAFVRTSRSRTADSPAIAVAGVMIEQLAGALSQDDEPRMKCSSGFMDDTNRAYYRMLGAVGDIQKRGEEYIARIESGGDMDASLALLLTFVRNYCGIADRFNRRFGGWAEFYRKNILHDRPKEAVQERTYVIIEPDRTKEAATFPLLKGTRFSAGQAADGSDLLYAAAEKAYIVPARIRAVHSLFCKECHLHAAALQPGAQEGATPLFDAQNPAAAALEYGWLLTARSLVLSEGRRTVSVGIRLGRVDGTSMPDLSLLAGNAAAFILQLSGSGGWLPMAYVSEYDRAACILRFTAVLDEHMEAPAACTEELHRIATEYPALRILFADEKAADALPPDLYIREITINTEAEGIRNFTLVGASGPVDPAQPFYPFGPTGERGSRLIFGHEEAALKNITAVTLKGAWTNLPENGFRPIYENYGLDKTVDERSFAVCCAWQEKSIWHECAGAPQPLFHRDGTGRLSDDALFELALTRNADTDALLPYRRDSGGFYRLTLVEPEIGFGTNTYCRRFIEVMMHNGRAKKKERKPVPEQPQVPMLCDVTFGYKSEETVRPGGGSGRLYRFSELSGYEACGAAGAESSLFRPCMESPSLLLHLDHMGDTNRVRLYFALHDAVRGWKPAVDRPSCKLAINRYAAGGIWQEVTDEHVLCEQTEGLTRSGFIEVKASAAKNADDLWLKFSLAGDKAPESLVLEGVYLNCLRVTAVNGDGNPLPAGTISAPPAGDSRILSVCQPFAGSGGRPAETDRDAMIRQRIRISSRNRAVCSGNYEELILEHFPEIEKACCIPASENNGAVRIVVLPKPEKRRYPFLPGWKLAEIEEWVKRLVSPFAKIRAVNPVYEPLCIVFRAVLKRETRDPGAVKRRLARRIRVFLMAWYMDGKLPDFGVRYSCGTLLSHIVNDECVEDFISLEIKTGGRQYRITETMPDKDLLLSAADECGILYVDRLDVELAASRCGVDEARIGTDFMIR